MTAYTGQLQVDFVHDPTSASFTWVDITNRGRSANYRRGRSYERNQVEAGGGTVKLRNDDGALDPTNGASTYSPNVIPFRRFQHNVTVTGPGTVPIFTGLVERWPQEWEAGYGYAPVRVVDTFAWLSLAQLRSAVQQEILADGPMIYMPLTDEAGTSTPSMVVAPAGAVASVKSMGNGLGAYAFAGSSGPAGEGAKALQLSPDSPGSIPDNGFYADATIANYSFVGTRRVLRAWVSGLGGGASPSQPIVYLVPGTGSAALMGLAAAAGTGKITALIVADNGTTLSTLLGNTSLTDGKPHDVVAEFIDGTAINLYVDGVLDATGACLAFSNFPDHYAEMQVGGKYHIGTGVAYASVGTFAHAAVYDTSGSVNVSNHYNAGAKGFAGETADARIARILRYAGWTATTALDACTTTMLGADIAGRDALSVIQDVEASEGGVFFASKAGTLTYKSRRTRMQTTTSSATFGENTAGGEVPWLGIAFDFDPTYVYNDVQITRTGAGHDVSASSSTSQAHYGHRTLPLTLGTQSDAEAQDAANWLLNVNLAPHLRVRSVAIDCLATPGACAAVLPLEIGSRVTVKKRPANGTTITANSFVESISWDIVDGKRALCTLELSPIPLQALIADDATYGICDSTFVAAW